MDVWRFGFNKNNLEFEIMRELERKLYSGNYKIFFKNFKKTQINDKESHVHGLKDLNC